MNKPGAHEFTSTELSLLEDAGISVDQEGVSGGDRLAHLDRHFAGNPADHVRSLQEELGHKPATAPAGTMTIDVFDPTIPPYGAFVEQTVPIRPNTEECNICDVRKKALEQERNMRFKAEEALREVQHGRVPTGSDMHHALGRIADVVSDTYVRPMGWGASSVSKLADRVEEKLGETEPTESMTRIAELVGWEGVGDWKKGAGRIAWENGLVEQIHRLNSDLSNERATVHWLRESLGVKPNLTVSAAQIGMLPPAAIQAAEDTELQRMREKMIDQVTDAMALAPPKTPGLAAMAADLRARGDVYPGRMRDIWPDAKPQHVATLDGKIVGTRHDYEPGSTGTGVDGQLFSERLKAGTVRRVTAKEFEESKVHGYDPAKVTIEIDEKPVTGLNPDEATWALHKFPVGNPGVLDEKGNIRPVETETAPITGTHPHPGKRVSMTIRDRSGNEYPITPMEPGFFEFKDEETDKGDPLPDVRSAEPSFGMIGNKACTCTFPPCVKARGEKTVTGIDVGKGPDRTVVTKTVVLPGKIQKIAMSVEIGKLPAERGVNGFGPVPASPHIENMYTEWGHQKTDPDAIMAAFMPKLEALASEREPKS